MLHLMFWLAAVVLHHTAIFLSVGQITLRGSYSRVATTINAENIVCEFCVKLAIVWI